MKDAAEKLLAMGERLTKALSYHALLLEIDFFKPKASECRSCENETLLVAASVVKEPSCIRYEYKCRACSRKHVVEVDRGAISRD